MEIWSPRWTESIEQLSMDSLVFFVTVKTSLGIGRVVATIVTQDETELLLTDGLKILKQWNPNWIPSYFMTDKSSIELGAIGSVFPNCIRLLCDFHRVQAWERWVSKTANGVLSSDKDVVLSYLKDLVTVIRKKV